MTQMKLNSVALVACIVVLAVIPGTDAIWLPGTAPKLHKENETVSLEVNSLRSATVSFPKDYYSFPFCRPNPVEDLEASLGEVLRGDRRHNSLYSFSFMKNESCKFLQPCNSSTNTQEIKDNAKSVKSMVNRKYRVYMSLDDLPVYGLVSSNFRCRDGSATDDEDYGYPLGVHSTCVGDAILYNHLHFRVEYNGDDGADDQYTVVGIDVLPYSLVRNGPDECTDTFDPKMRGNVPLNLSSITSDAVKVHWTYGVTWVLNKNVKWASRWDAYFKHSVANSKAATHWMFIGVGTVLALLLSGAVGGFLARALHKDFVRYNSLDPEELQEETGWKLVHADVFRPPSRAPLLCCCVGNGVQLLFMVAFILLLALAGFLAPTHRGALPSCVVFLFILSSFVGGYACGVLLKYLNCQSWKYVFLSSVLFPSVVVVVYLFGTFLSLLHRSTAAVPFTTLLLLFFLGIFLNVPLCVLGASFAFHQETLSNPVRVGRLAREIPEQHAMNQLPCMLIIYPVFPLMTVLAELQFIMQSLWADQVYYVFFFFFIAFLLWLVTASLVTMLQLYYVLCYENHRWWWIAFMLPGGFGLHLFVYSIWFFATNLSIVNFATTLLYFAYMAVLSIGYGLASGAVGVITGIAFVRLIYSRIKVD